MAAPEGVFRQRPAMATTHRSWFFADFHYGADDPGSDTNTALFTSLESELRLLQLHPAVVMLLGDFLPHVTITDIDKAADRIR